MVMALRRLVAPATGILAILALTACSGTPISPTATPPSTAPAATPAALTLEQLSAIQPALGTVMMEYANRFDNTWFAAQAGNWDMVRYQIMEMVEIQEVGETTRPARAAALKAFEQGFLNPLQDTANKKDLASFVDAYDKAINGCNSCHASQTSSDFPGSYKFVKIQRPIDPALRNVDWRGQQ